MLPKVFSEFVSEVNQYEYVKGWEIIYYSLLGCVFLRISNKLIYYFLYLNQFWMVLSPDASINYWEFSARLIIFVPLIFCRFWSLSMNFRYKKFSKFSLGTLLSLPKKKRRNCYFRYFFRKMGQFWDCNRNY